MSPTARALIQDPSNEILISPASYWEIAIKISIGKWRLNRPYDEFIDIGLEPVRFPDLADSAKHTARLIGLPFPPSTKTRSTACSWLKRWPNKFRSSVPTCNSMPTASPESGKTT